MTTVTKTAEETAQDQTLQRRRFTTKEYIRMAEAGIVGEGERVELVEGEILIMAPIGRDHGAGVSRQFRVLTAYAPGRFTIWTQTTIYLGEDFSPEPDLVILKFREDDYAGKDPAAEDILLIIEDARSSLAYDRDTKSRLYAVARVPETWVVDLQGRAMERFADPGPDGYRQHTTLHSGERIRPVLLPDIELAVDDLLPPVVVEEPAEAEPQG